MIYSDGELRRWWAEKSKLEKAELLGLMIEKSSSPNFALSLSRQVESGAELTPKQLQAVRKWERK